MKRHEYDANIGEAIVTFLRGTSACSSRTVAERFRINPEQARLWLKRLQDQGLVVRLPDQRVRHNGGSGIAAFWAAAEGPTE